MILCWNYACLGLFRLHNTRACNCLVLGRDLDRHKHVILKSYAGLVLAGNLATSHLVLQIQRRISLPDQHLFGVGFVFCWDHNRLCSFRPDQHLLCNRLIDCRHDSILGRGLFDLDQPRHCFVFGGINTNFGAFGLVQHLLGHGLERFRNQNRRMAGSSYVFGQRWSHHQKASSCRDHRFELHEPAPAATETYKRSSLPIATHFNHALIFRNPPRTKGYTPATQFHLRSIYRDTGVLCSSQ